MVISPLTHAISFIIFESHSESAVKEPPGLFLT